MAYENSWKEKIMNDTNYGAPMTRGLDNTRSGNIRSEELKSIIAIPRYSINCYLPVSRSQAYCKTFVWLMSSGSSVRIACQWFDAFQRNGKQMV